MRRRTLVAAAAASLNLFANPLLHTQPAPATMTDTTQLTPKQLAIAPIGAATARGDLPQLSAALEQGLNAGLSISDAKEVLVQLYAYAGFPRSLNALGELMTVLQARRQ